MTAAAAAIAQALEQLALGFGALARERACELHAPSLHDPVAGGGTPDRQAVSLHHPNATLVAIATRRKLRAKCGVVPACQARRWGGASWASGGAAVSMPMR